MQKTAYDMRISDWSSDVCSSDLDPARELPGRRAPGQARARARARAACCPRAGRRPRTRAWAWRSGRTPKCRDRESVVSGKSVSVRVDVGGLRIIKKKQIQLCK